MVGNCVMHLLSKPTWSIHAGYRTTLPPAATENADCPRGYLPFSSPILHPRQPETAFIRAPLTQPVYGWDLADGMKQGNSESMSREQPCFWKWASSSYIAPKSASPACLGKPLHSCGTTRQSTMINPAKHVPFQSISPLHRSASVL